jgi:predicted  nucleic acid-binding Zn-ribbon protein
MAPTQQKNLVSRLADVGEEAFQRLADAPGADRVMGAMTSMRERMDDMQKRLRGLEALEKRVVTLERRLDKVEGKKSTSTRGVAATTARKSSAKSSSGKTTPSQSRSSAAKRQTGES